MLVSRNTKKLDKDALSYGLRPDCWIGPATCQHERVAGTQVWRASESAA